jgi:hypothetical protein
MHAGEFRKYNTSWVIAQAELQNKHYFTHMIAYKKGTPNTARKVVSALQWYCNCCYNQTAFTVESPHVHDALWLQKACGLSTGNLGSCPLKGLKDGVPEVGCK